MHRSESEVHTDHHQPEVPFSETLAQLTAEHLGPPVVEAREQTEHCATEQHIVEVGNDVIGVSLLSVRRGNRVGNARQTTNGELNNQRNGEHHRHGKREFAAPHCHDPVHDLDTGWNCNRHRCHREYGDRHWTKTRGEHVVGPYAPTNETDCGTRHRNDGITKQRLLREHRKDFADNAEGRQNHDVHLRVTEDPEQVLPQEWVGARSHIKECRIK